MAIKGFGIMLGDGRFLDFQDPEFQQKLPITTHMLTEIDSADSVVKMVSAVAVAVMGLEAKGVSFDTKSVAPDPAALDAGD